MNRGSDYPDSDEGDHAKRKLEEWKPNEDERLVMLYSKYPENWSKISELIETHDNNACRLRYRKIKTNSTVGKWSEEETQKLLYLHRLYKDNWKLIEK